MNFSSLPSLQSMAATQIATRLWNRADVVALIAGCDESYRGEDWGKIEDTVNEKILLLCQPAPLREKLSSVVVPMGDQIRRWKDKHGRLYGFENIPREFCRTSRGTLDEKGTAEAFVRDPALPEGERYDMACFYCLEWDDPVPFHGTDSYPLRGFRAYWTYDRTGDATALDSTLERDTSKTPYQSAFGYAVAWCNQVAAEYYFRKLSAGEREESLSDDELPYFLLDFDFFRFLLRHMSGRQQWKLLEAHAQNVLLSSLQWPWQQFFVDVARRVRDILKRSQYSRLLEEIVEKIREGYQDFSYRELFGAFWRQIPADHKKDVTRDCRLLGELFPFIGEKNISLVLKDASPEEREQILFSEGGVGICSRLADGDVWDALECFVGECVTSLDEMIRLKQECERRAKRFDSAYFQFLDGLIEKCSENRGREEADCSVPGRLCGSSDVPTDQV